MLQRGHQIFMYLYIILHDEVYNRKKWKEIKCRRQTSCHFHFRSEYICPSSNAYTISSLALKSGHFNNLMHWCFHIFPRGGHHEDDLLQHPSPVAGQHGFCSSFYRGHQWLISTALEANADIDTHHAGLHTEPKWAELHSTGLVKHTYELPLEGLWKNDLRQSGACPRQWRHHSVTTATSGPRPWIMFCLWSGALVAELDCAAPPHLDKPGLWAMSLLSALCIVCGLMLHVSFSALNTHYCVPRKTISYQSKSQSLSASPLICNGTFLLCCNRFTLNTRICSSLRMYLNILTMIYEQIVYL